MAIMLGTAAQADGAATYDLLFRDGTLDSVSKDVMLHYERDVTNALVTEAGPRDTGDVTLSFEGGEPLQVSLLFERDGKHRNLGTFPASVGNPIIMYFVETVVRDMAESAGGSPFYIRNRVKEALITPTDVIEGEAQFGDRIVSTQTVVLHPFAEDPNRDKMKGFGDLALSVTMSDAVPGWYLTLSAAAQGAEAPVYSSVLSFSELEESK